MIVKLIAKDVSSADADAQAEALTHGQDVGFVASDTDHKAKDKYAVGVLNLDSLSDDETRDYLIAGARIAAQEMVRKAAGYRTETPAAKAKRVGRTVQEKAKALGITEEQLYERLAAMQPTA